MMRTLAAVSTVSAATALAAGTMPAAALAAQPRLAAGPAAASRTALTTQPRAIAATAVSGPVRTATGTVTAVGWSLTIQTGGRLMGRINAMNATANLITRQDYPYVYGGGHAMAGVASIGMKGPGYTGHTRGYDCSGSVAAVLAGAGLWPAGSGVPSDAGVVQQLLQAHDIARGAGRGPSEVTLYDHPGIHIFMNISGRFFGTSDGAGGGSRKGGAGWLDDGAPDAASRLYRQYHVLPSVLRDRTTYGHSLTFLDTNEPITAGTEIGDRVRVGYQVTGSGEMVLRTLVYVGAASSAGMVTSVATDGSSFAIQTPAGQAMVFSTGTDHSLTAGLQAGDQIQVRYTNSGGVLTARALTITAQATPTTATGGG